MARTGNEPLSAANLKAVMQKVSGGGVLLAVGPTRTATLSEPYGNFRLLVVNISRDVSASSGAGTNYEGFECIADTPNSFFSYEHRVSDGEYIYASSGNRLTFNNTGDGRNRIMAVIGYR